MKETLDPNYLLAIPLLPLATAFISGVFCSVLPRRLVHWLTILGVLASFLISAHVAGSIFCTTPRPSTARCTSGW